VWIEKFLSSLCGLLIVVMTVKSFHLTQLLIYHFRNWKWMKWKKRLRWRRLDSINIKFFFIISNVGGWKALNLTHTINLTHFPILFIASLHTLSKSEMNSFHLCVDVDENLLILFIFLMTQYSRLSNLLELPIAFGFTSNSICNSSYKLVIGDKIMLKKIFKESREFSHD
jgi:hypothetical protein